MFDEKAVIECAFSAIKDFEYPRSHLFGLLRREDQLPFLGTLEIPPTEGARHNPFPVAVLPKQQVPKFVRHDVSKDQGLRQTLVGGGFLHLAI